MTAFIIHSGAGLNVTLHYLISLAHRSISIRNYLGWAYSLLVESPGVQFGSYELIISSVPVGNGLSLSFKTECRIVYPFAPVQWHE